MHNDHSCSSNYAQTMPKFKSVMMNLKSINIHVWSYLNNNDPKALVKAYYSQWPKLDNINNMVVVWNAKMSKHRNSHFVNARRAEVLFDEEDYIS